MKTITRSCICCGDSLGQTLALEIFSIAGLGETQMNLKICDSCGCVIQDPVASPDVMEYYYKNLSNYTNISRGGAPATTSVEAKSRQISIIQDHIRPGSMYEVGCATGYVLSELKKIGWSVAGCDPSASAAIVALDLYNIEIQTGLFDDIEIAKESTDLVLISHVLEHIYQPVDFLKKANRMLSEEGYLLVEVPCLTNPESWGNGYFTFEHINIFSKNSLVNCIIQTGFQPEHIEVNVRGMPYPVITVLAKKVRNPEHSIYEKDDPVEVRKLIDVYLKSNDSDWQRINQLLESELQGFEKIVVWGGGVHTSQLLHNTSAIKHSNVIAIVDRDIQKHGMKVCDIEIVDCTSVDFNDTTIAVVISSKASEYEINSFLLSELKAKSKIISLYH